MSSKNSYVNTAMWDWFEKVCSRLMIVTGLLLQEKAPALVMGHTEFTGSNGWLESWKKKHGAKSSVVSVAEGANMNETDVKEWAQRIPALCKGFALIVIFNADETRLFF